MSRGRAYGGWLIAGALVLTFLIATNTWNPFPGLWGWISAAPDLSDPAPAWQQRLGGAPVSVTQVGTTLIVEQRTWVEARRSTDGGQLWKAEADWSAVAGADATSVVVHGKLLHKGYDVVDPVSGARLRHDDRAVAVWTYRDAVLDVHCRGAKDCTLTAWPPRGTAALWSTDIPGIGFVFFADNPDLLDADEMSARKVEDHVGGPVTMPRLIALPINGKVYVVDTDRGRTLPAIDPGRRESVVAIGERIVTITATPGDGGCYFSVRGTDANGEQVWEQAGLNLGTVSGGGCTQRDRPTGGGNVVRVVSPDGRQALLNAYDGRVLWIGKTGETVLAVDNRRAVVRSADGHTLRGIRFGREEPLWKRSVNPDARAALGRGVVVITDREPDRIIVLDPGTGAEKLNLRSGATVLSAGPEAVVLGNRRELGYLTYPTGGA